MNEAKRILRWGIPGYIFILVLVGNYLILKFLEFLNSSILINDYSKLFSFFSNFLTINSSLLVIFITIFGIPLGYILYQVYNVYHYKFQNSLIEEFPHVYDEIKKNLEIDNSEFDNKLPPEYLKKFYEKDRIFAKIYYKLNDYSNQKISDDELINLNKEQTLSDMAHSLRSVQFSLAVANIFCFLINYSFLSYENFFQIRFFGKYLLDIIIPVNIFTVFSMISDSAITIIISIFIWWILKICNRKIILHQVYIIYEMSKKLKKPIL